MPSPNVQVSRPTGTHHTSGTSSKTSHEASSTSSTSSTSSSSSSPIPMPPSHVHRTRSELQLADDCEMARVRETVMFHRLVQGMTSLGLGSLGPGAPVVPIPRPPQEQHQPATTMPPTASLSKHSRETTGKTTDLKSVLRRASEKLFSLGLDLDRDEEETVDGGIFHMDDI